MKHTLEQQIFGRYLRIPDEHISSPLKIYINKHIYTACYYFYINDQEVVVSKIVVLDKDKNVQIYKPEEGFSYKITNKHINLLRYILGSIKLWYIFFSARQDTRRYLIQQLDQR